MFKIDSNMINLIGCTKENFYKILELMEYKPKNIKDEKEKFFIYKPKFLKNIKKNMDKKISKDSPFNKLSKLILR